MKPNTNPTIPPALRKARKPEEISNAFPPIVPRARPSEPLPATAPPSPTTPTSSASSPTSAPVEVPPPSSAPTPTLKTPSPLPSTPSVLAKPKSVPLAPTAAAPIARENVSTIKTRPKPVFTGRPAVAQLEGKIVVFEGTFRHEENASFTTETRLTGDPKRDKQSLINLARKRYPTGQMELKSTRIFSRETGAQVSYPKGISVSQVFGESGSPTENALEIGSVFWGGERCQIFLVNLRSRSAVNIALRQPGGARVSFSNHIAANTPASTLKQVVKEVLGQDARELSLTLKIDQ